jgi:hypothetical protein
MTDASTSLYGTGPTRSHSTCHRHAYQHLGQPRPDTKAYVTDRSLQTGNMVNGSICAYHIRPWERVTEN